LHGSVQNWAGYLHHRLSDADYAKAGRQWANEANRMPRTSERSWRRHVKPNARDKPCLCIVQTANGVHNTNNSFGMASNEPTFRADQ